MTNTQYFQKMEDHLSTSTYTLLKKNPTDSLSRKLDNVLKKLLKEGKISKTFHDNIRVLHPRAPQLYGLPKIHKPGNPLRPIVSFYDTSLSTLHKQLSEVLKPLTLQYSSQKYFVTKTLKPAMNIQHKGPSVNSCWNPLLPKIVASFRDTSADIEIWDAQSFA